MGDELYPATISPAARSLNQSEQLFRSLCDHAPVAMLYVDERGECGYVNRACARLAGREQRSALEMDWKSWIAEQDRERFVTDYQRAVESNATLEREFRIRRLDGEVVWVRGSATPRMNDRGDAEGYVIILTETDQATALTKAERILEGENQLLETFARGIPLEEGLLRLVRFIEDQSEEVIASILLFDESHGCLRHGAAPGLSASYNQAVDGIEIGDGMGSCGTAAWRQQPVIVEDIETDPLWAAFRDLARTQGVRSCWSTPIHDAHGALLGTFAIYRRVPGRPTTQHQRLMEAATHLASMMLARHRDEKSLEESEEQLRMTQFSVDSCNTSVFWIRQDASFFYANDAAVESFGYSREELLSMTVHQIDPGYSADVWPDYWEQIKKLHSMTFKSAMQVKDGDVIPVEITTNYLEYEGQEFVFAFVHDITQREESERELEFQADVLNRVSDAVFVTGPVGGLSYANEAAYRLFRRLDDSDDERQLAALHDELIATIPCQDEIHRSLCVSGEWQGEHELRINGQYRCLETKLKAFLSPSGDEQLLLSVIRDISLRRKAEHQNRQHRDMLAHVARLSTMGELVAGIAHEVKQPLYAISNFTTAASVALRGIGQDQPIRSTSIDGLRECNDGIRHASDRANEIIHRLRDFARRGEQRRENVRLNDVIQDSVNLVAFKARECHASIEWQLADDLPEVAVDRIQCEQVIVNLLNNAYEAIAESDFQGRVVIRTLRNGDDVELQIRDNGPGIDQHQHGRLFEAFYTTKRDGMGMGLAISRTIVEDHGGRLWAQTNSEGGATFHVSLPAVNGRFSLAD